MLSGVTPIFLNSGHAKALSNVCVGGKQSLHVCFGKANALFMIAMKRETVSLRFRRSNRPV
jgi:hypothetical protein